MAGRKGADKHTIQSQDRDPTQPAPCSQTHQLLRCSFPKTFAPANPSIGGQVGREEDVPHSPSTAHPEQGWQAQNSSPLAEPSTSTLSPQPLLQLDSSPEQTLREGSIPLCLA